MMKLSRAKHVLFILLVSWLPLDASAQSKGSIEINAGADFMSLNIAGTKLDLTGTQINVEGIAYLAKNLAINGGGSFSTATGDGIDGTSTGGWAGVAFASNQMNIDGGSGNNTYFGIGATIATSNLSYYGAPLTVNETLIQPAVKAGGELSFAPKTMLFISSTAALPEIDNVLTRVGIGYKMEQFGLIKFSGQFSYYFDTENASSGNDLGLRVGYAYNF